MSDIILPINESDSRFLTNYKSTKKLDKHISNTKNISNISDYKKYLITFAKENVDENFYTKNLQIEINKLPFIKKINII